MGKLEKESKYRTRKQNIQKLILNTLYGAGIISIELLAPNAIGALDKLTGSNFRNKNYRVKRSRDRLLDAGLIRFEKTPTGTFVEITSKGEQKIKKFYAGEAVLKKPTRWDGKWRLVIYDLKEKRKFLRDRLRITLASFGFVRLQNSVWVYPYDCEDLIILVKADFKIGKEVLYLIVDRVENDKWLRDLFNLK